MALRDPRRSLPPPLPFPRASRAGPSRPAAPARSSSGSAASQVPAAGPRLHLAHRALFLCPTGKPKQLEPRRRGKGNGKQEGRRRCEVTLASESGLPGRPPGGQGACAERRRRAAGAQAWPGRSRSESSVLLR